MTAPCALYRHFDAAGRLLYVGVSCDPLSRTRAHRSAAKWFSDVVRIEIEWHKSARFAHVAEVAAIIRERPVHNVQHRHGNQVREFVGKVGRKTFACRLGVKPSAVSNAETAGTMPTAWALVVAQMCVEMQIFYPALGFRWIDSDDGAASEWETLCVSQIFPKRFRNAA